LKEQGITKTHGIRNPLKRLYTIEESAVYLGRSVWSIRELIWKGEIPSVKVGRRLHVDIIDMDTFIEKNKVCETF